MKMKNLVQVRVDGHWRIGELVRKGTPVGWGNKAPYDYINTLRPVYHGGWACTGPITRLTEEQVAQCQPYSLKTLD